MNGPLAFFLGMVLGGLGMLFAGEWLAKLAGLL